MAGAAAFYSTVLVPLDLEDDSTEAVPPDSSQSSTLRERRIQACDKFASKCATSARFSSWFPPRESGRSRGRKAEVFHEDYTRCDRLKNSPIFYMRRRLKGKEGKIYGERNKIYRDTNTDHVRSARRRRE